MKGDVEMPVTYFTPAELRAVRSSVRCSIELRSGMIKPEIEHAYRAEPKVLRKIRQYRKEVPVLRSALSKLR